MHAALCIDKLLTTLQNDLCETTDGVRSYSGYVHLPAGALADLGVQNQTYEINTFFWFFESRKDPANAPLSIWMVCIHLDRHRLHPDTVLERWPRE